MLLGNGVITNKLPITNFGGVQCNTNWNRDEIILGLGSFDLKASMPDGYGLIGYEKAIKAGNISSTNQITFSGVGSGAMGINIEATSDLSLFFGDAYGDLIVSGQGSASFDIQSMGNVIAGLYGIGTASYTVTASNNSVFADGYASAQLDIVTSGQGQLTAIAIMSGTSIDNTGELTPAQIWSYDNRTLTSIDVEVSGLTADEHDKLMKLITKSEFLALKDV